MDEHLNGAFEDSVVTFDFELSYVDSVEMGDDFCHLVEQPELVESFHIDGDGEQHGAVHLPLGTQHSVASIGFESLGCGALELVDDDVAVVVDVAHDGVAWYGLAVVAQDVFVLYAVFGQGEEFFLVEVWPYGFFGLLVLFLCLFAE